MHYDNSLGIFGNIRKLYTERNTTNANLDNEVSLQASNKIESEQAITDLDLAVIVAEQNNTDLDLRVTALEGQE